MKKLIFVVLATTTLLACQSKSEMTATAAYPANASGYHVDSSANTAIVRKAVQAMEANDTATYRSLYAANAVFHDNIDSMTLDQNISLVSLFQKNGVTVKITSMEPIWEEVNKVASPTGVNNYVISYQLAEFTKGDKKVKVIMNSVDAMKDGKIVEEWNTYDTRKIEEILK